MVALLDKMFTALNIMFYKILSGVLLYAPIGIFAISATAFGSQGLETFKALLTFTAVFYLGLLILWVVVYTGFLKLSGTPVVNFFKQTKDAYTTAFFTSSSIASLPIAIEAAKKAGISDKTANFALPLGAVFNSDGGALRMGVSIVFAANITNLNLSVSDFVMIIVIGTLLSIGTSGVPAAGLVTLSAVLTMFGLPLEIVALIAGVDAIIGMGGTASNVVGDIVGAAVVDRTEERNLPKESIYEHKRGPGTNYSFRGLPMFSTLDSIYIPLPFPGSWFSYVSLKWGSIYIRDTLFEKKSKEVYGLYY